MKVIYGIGSLKKKIKNVVCAIGVFDGIHVGHQKLLKMAKAKARAVKGPLVVLTFWPHPVHVLRPEQSLPLIVSLPHRLRLLEKFEAAICIVVRFTKRFSKLSPQQFIKRYLADSMNVKEVFIGDDFRFGQNREGSITLLKALGKRYGFRIHAITALKGELRKVGSSQIRNLIANGQLAKARRLLKRDISITGKVTKGDGRGKGLGYPTANLSSVQEILPPRGVYAVYVEIKGKKYKGMAEGTTVAKGMFKGMAEGTTVAKGMFKGMANIGFRPSFKRNKEKLLVEVHIFNFAKSIYGQELEVHFIKKIRKERSFPTRDHLTAQLKRDEKRARAILRP